MAKEDKKRFGELVVTVRDEFGDHVAIGGAPTKIYFRSGKSKQEAEKQAGQGEPNLNGYQLVWESETDDAGRVSYEGPAGIYLAVARPFHSTFWGRAPVHDRCVEDIQLVAQIDLKVTARRVRDGRSEECETFTSGDTVEFLAQHRDLGIPLTYKWKLDGGLIIGSPGQKVVVQMNKTGSVKSEVTISGSARMTTFGTALVVPQTPQLINGSVGVTLRRTATAPTSDLPLWVVIRKSTEAISWDNYSRFMDLVLCGIGKNPQIPTSVETRFNTLQRFLPYNDADAYRLLKVATEAFLMVNCGIFLAQPNFTQEDLDDLLSHVSMDGRVIDLAALNALWQSYLGIINGGPDTTIPYLGLIRDKLRDQPVKLSLFAGVSADLPEGCFGILREKLTNPCFLELIWSYWHEEGMLVQTLNALNQRFQNIRGPGDRDPLAMIEIDPLRPLNNLLWGYIQDEQHRLSVIRRVYEYNHHYGLTLYGKAVPSVRPADSRSKFIEAFHNLLYLCSIFFKEDDDTTVIADGFPILNGLKEVHFVLTEGAHNQFGDLPSTARQEMMVQQWIMARPEFREYLPTRIMVAYPERWMDRVDAMKTLQGWTDTSVLHFRNLGAFGEQILLSIRFGAWSTVNDPMQAANWARFWRAELQGYIHAYRAATGVDLTVDVADSRMATERYLQPSVHLRNRLSMQQRSLTGSSQNVLGPGDTTTLPSTSRGDFTPQRHH